MNSVWEAYIRAFISWSQEDWVKYCPMAQIAINGRDATSTRVAPFFLQHGYNVDPLQLDTPLGAEKKRYTAEERSDREKAEAIVAKFRDVFDLAQASMAIAQAEQEKQTNRHRKEARNYRVGDKVWLKLDKQYRTGRPSRKLDWKSAKYTVIEVIDSHSVKLDTPKGHHPVFHVDRLRLANSDPLPSQVQDDYQPLPLQIDGEDEWVVEEILEEQLRRRGRGWKLYFDVKWKGYHQTTLEPVEILENTEALDRWEEYTREYRDEAGRLPEGFRRDTP
jgi:ribosomal protein L21E